MSGDYITSDMYEKLLINNAIWIAHGIDNDEFLGALHQTLQVKQLVFHMWQLFLKEEVDT